MNSTFFFFQYIIHNTCNDYFKKTNFSTAPGKPNSAPSGHWLPGTPPAPGTAGTNPTWVSDAPNNAPSGHWLPGTAPTPGSPGTDPTWVSDAPNNAPSGHWLPGTPPTAGAAGTDPTWVQDVPQINDQHAGGPNDADDNDALLIMFPDATDAQIEAIKKQIDATLKGVPGSQTLQLDADEYAEIRSRLDSDGSYPKNPDSSWNSGSSPKSSSNVQWIDGGNTAAPSNSQWYSGPSVSSNGWFSTPSSNGQLTSDSSSNTGNAQWSSGSGINSNLSGSLSTSYPSSNFNVGVPISAAAA